VTGVVRGPGPLGEDLFIAGQLLLEVEAANRPPDKRVEPVDRSGEAGHRSQRPVEAGDVDHLVEHHRLPAFPHPLLGVRGQHDDRAQESDSGRNLHLGAGDQPHPSPASGLVAGGSKHRQPVVVFHRQGAADGAGHPPQTDSKPGQH